MTFSESHIDIRDLLGMRSRGAWLILGCYFTAMAVVTVATLGHVANPWPPILATGIIVAATVALVITSGDPLPMPTTIVLTLSGPTASALVLSVTPGAPHSSLQTWIHSGAVAIYCFMNVRGRRITPWLGLAGTAAVFGAWAALSGEDPIAGVSLVAVDAAPLAMALLLSFTLRPTAKAVFSLRTQTTARIAELSADTAVAEERANQLRHLDSLVRPLLERIADSQELSHKERLECELLEAHLRDRIRAPLLSTLQLDDAAYEARVRGVEVVFLDDRAGHGLDEILAAAIRAAASRALASASTGQICVRVLPVGRHAAASITVRNEFGFELHEIDHAGVAHRSFSVSTGFV